MSTVDCIDMQMGRLKTICHQILNLGTQKQKKVYINSTGSLCLQIEKKNHYGRNKKIY